MKKWLILMPLLIAVQFAAMLVMETLGIEKQIYHAVGAGIAGGLSAFIAQRIGLLPIQRS